jgi:pimeloyl-ACP methyl ester carboxylesterase
MCPYFTGIKNIEVVDVGPITNVEVRAERLRAHIRAHYPDWSAAHPVNLVGHSFGCNTILALALMEEVEPSSLRSLVLISPASRGFSGTYGLGRRKCLRGYLQFIMGVLLVYEYIVPEWVRRTLLFHTQLPTTLSWRNLSSAEGTLLFDIDELVAGDLCCRGMRYVQTHRIACRTFVSSISEQDPEGRHVVPYRLGPAVVLRLAAYLFGVGTTTDYDQGYSFVSEDVSTYRLRNGPHDGVLLEASQTCTDAFRVRVDHLGPVLMLPLQSQETVHARRRLMQQVVDFL